MTRPGATPGATPGVVYVVAKAPRPGHSKTRLSPPLTPEGAARLARGFLLDVLQVVARAGLVPRIISRDPGEQEALRRLAGSGVAVHVQEGRGLGDALESAFRRGLAGGAPVVGVLGADIPTLPPAVLTEACRAVQDGHHVALGRSEDGGYYLLAAGAVYPSLFREMTWSTEGVADETLRRCAAAGLRPFLLPTWADVDDGPALAALRDELRRAPPGVAPHTRGVLEALEALEAPPEVILPATRRP